MSKLIELMRKAGLSNNYMGVCLGTANTASMAYLSGKDHFRHSLERMTMINELDINNHEAIQELLTNQEWEIRPFLESIELFQNWYNYQHLQNPSSMVNLDDLRKITQSKALEVSGGVHKIASISGLYRRDDLLAYLSSFQEACEKQPAPIRQTLLLNSVNHVTMLAYDAESKQWLYHNHGDTYLAGADEIDKVCDELMRFYDSGITLEPGAEESLALGTEMYSTGNQLNENLQLLNDWQSSSLYQDIHQVTVSKAKAKDVLAADWLMIAVKNNDLELTQQLIEKGADVNFPTPDRQYPLHFAAVNAGPELIYYLLEQGAEPGKRSRQGLTALDMAAFFKNTDAINCILTKAPDEVYSLINAPGIDYNLPSGKDDRTLDEFIIHHAGQIQDVVLFKKICEKIPSGELIKKISNAVTSEQERLWMYRMIIEEELNKGQEVNTELLIEIIHSKSFSHSNEFKDGISFGDILLSGAFYTDNDELYQAVSKSMNESLLDDSISRLLSMVNPEMKDSVINWFENARSREINIKKPAASSSSGGLFAKSKHQPEPDDLSEDKAPKPS